MKKPDDETKTMIERVYEGLTATARTVITFLREDKPLKELAKLASINTTEKVLSNYIDEQKRRVLDNIKAQGSEFAESLDGKLTSRPVGRPRKIFCGEDQVEQWRQNPMMTDEEFNELTDTPRFRDRLSKCCERAYKDMNVKEYIEQENAGILKRFRHH